MGCMLHWLWMTWDVWIYFHHAYVWKEWRLDLWSVEKNTTTFQSECPCVPVSVCNFLCIFFQSKDRDPGENPEHYTIHQSTSHSASSWSTDSVYVHRQKTNPDFEMYARPLLTCANTKYQHAASFRWYRLHFSWMALTSDCYQYSFI